jgi:alanine dehydrogenase
MKIAVPRERKTLEKRVALTPRGAKELCERGHEVCIETAAGAGSFYRDEDYLQAGCKIAPNLKSVWSDCDLLVKVKEPHETEFPLFRPGLKIFTYLHLAGLPAVAHALVEQKVTGIAYELVEAADGSLPLLAPMSQVAGKLAVQNAAHYLLTQNGGRGVLLGGTEKVAPGKVIVLGAGIAGFAAAQVAAGMGANVLVLDLNSNKLEALNKKLPQVRTAISSEQTISTELNNSDIVISAVLIPGAKAPRVLTKSQLDLLPRGGCGFRYQY